MRKETYRAEMKIKDLNKKRFHMFSDRIFVIGFMTVMMFLTIIYQFYKIQIIEHDEYDEELRATTQKEVDIPAIRGLIYDRYGKPLAINKAVYMLKVDPQVTLKEGVLDETLLKVAKLLEANGDEYIDEMPISAKAPFVYTEDQKSCERFITNYVPYNDTEQKTEVLYKMTAEEMIAYLRSSDVFNIDDHFSDEEARKIIAMRLIMRQTTYQKYVQVTLAQDISMRTLAAIEENKDEYPSIFVAVESQRYYPYEEAFGNILGYTRRITESQYNKLKDEGYENDDIIGQVGIESTKEAELRGEKGRKFIEVDNVGRTVNTTEIEPATSGNDIYLSIDAELQKQVYDTLEKRLANGIVERLKRVSSKVEPLTGREILVSMAKNNQLDLKEMSTKDTSTMQGKLYEKILASYQAEVARLEEAEATLPDEEKTNLSIKQHFANMLDSEVKVISDQELLLAMGEQQTLAFTESQMAAIHQGNYSVDGLLINLLESGLLKPDQMDITPCSGSAVIVDPNNGQTLALVSYPSYDNNAFIQDFNGIYSKLHDGVDTRNIEINRALKTAKAPGSTFKMVTAIAGLEENVVTPETLIYDTGVYTNAGTPGPHCWIYDNQGHGHGALNVKQALEVSCNYYFYDVAYRLGLKYGNPYGGIDMLSRYAEQFGLGDKTGIELEEVSPNISNPTNLVHTYAAKSLNYIRTIKDKNKKELYDLILEQVQNGIYVSGGSGSKDIEEQIAYLAGPYLKDKLNSELAIVLSEDLSNIYDKMLDDFNEEMIEGVGSFASEIASTVMTGDASINLKKRTKAALSDLLEKMVQPGTRKTIGKTIAKIPNGVLQGIYLEGYKAALAQYKDQPEMSKVCEALRSHIADLEKESFDYQSIVTQQVIDGIIAVYVDDYFQNVDLNWTAAINIRTGIGQGNNTFTPVQMARYIAGLANGEKVYNLTVLSGMKDNKGTGEYVKNTAEVYGTLNFDKKNLQAIYEGMHDVVSGSSGTARSYFTNMSVQVAGKTGTAQANDGESSLFVGFAPYTNPEIAIVTSMYGTDGVGSNNSLLARECFEIYYRTNEQTDKVTLGNQFMP